MGTLFQRSIEIILRNQSPGGAYIASPNFSTYSYAWFRDGSFCAYAMDRVGQPESSRRFFSWTIQTISRHREKIERCIRQARAGHAPTLETAFHARFTLEGEEIPGRWGNHQLDGIGAWLWAICCHLGQDARLSLPAGWLPVIHTMRDYLIALWKYPCSDLWEEHEDKIHSYTLGAVYAGLNALAEVFEDEEARQVAGEIRRFLSEKAVVGGRLAKFIAGQSVDASLAALCTPYHVFEYDDLVMKASLQAIEDQLGGHEGGVHRYRQDTYYGGGEWIILAAWLGWAYFEGGEIERALFYLRWIEKQANREGELPEQIAANLNAPAEYLPWKERWGPIATPLLWSHAMYLILHLSLDDFLSTSRRSE